MFPLFTTPGMSFSYPNYQLCNSSVYDTMNIHMNQVFADSLARQSLYNVPQYSFGQFSPYQYSFSNNYLLDLNYTLGQFNFNNGGILSGMSPNFGQTQWTPWGYQPVNSSSSNSSTTEAEKEKEALAKKQYEALKALLETYKKHGNCSDEIETKIDTAFGKTGKYSEKLEALKGVYKQLNKDKLRKAVALLPNDYKEDLEIAGYKFGKTNSYANNNNKTTSNLVKTLKEEINELSKDTKECEAINNNIEGLAEIAQDKNNILNIISLWNDNNNTDANRNIINAIYAKASSLNKNVREEIIKNNVKPIVDALVAKASIVIENENLDEDTVEIIEKLSKDLEDAYDKNNSTGVKTNFEKLYVALRITEAKTINKEINNKYNFLNDIASDDNDFINDDIITKETASDLKEEGLESVYKNINSGITITNEEEEEYTEQTIEEQVQEAVTSGVLRAETTSNGETIYIETKPAEGEPARRFIIKDDELVEYSTTSNSATNTSVSVEDITTVHNEALKIEEEEKELEETEDVGRKVAENLRGGRKGTKNTRVNRLLDENEINENNIVAFLDGLYSDKERNYFEKMEKRRRKGEIDFDNRMNIIKATLAKAKSEGLEDTDAYMKLEAVCERYETDGKHANKEHFRSRNKTERNWWSMKDKSSVFSAVTTGAAATGIGAVIGHTVATTSILGSAIGGPVGTVCGAFIGLVIVGIGALATLCFGKVSDAEVIDTCIKELHQEIKDAENDKKTNENKEETEKVQETQEDTKKTQATETSSKVNFEA